MDFLTLLLWILSFWVAPPDWYPNLKDLPPTLSRCDIAYQQSLDAINNAPWLTIEQRNNLLNQAWQQKTQCEIEEELRRIWWQQNPPWATP